MLANRSIFYRPSTNVSHACIVHCRKYHIVINPSFLAPLISNLFLHDPKYHSSMCTEQITIYRCGHTAYIQIPCMEFVGTAGWICRSPPTDKAAFELKVPALCHTCARRKGREAHGKATASIPLAAARPFPTVMPPPSPPKSPTVDLSRNDARSGGGSWVDMERVLGMEGDPNCGNPEDRNARGCTLQ